MGANFKNFEVGNSGGVLGIVLLIIFIGILGLIAYKVFLAYKEKQRWAWLTQLGKDRKLSQKELIFLKNVAMKKQFKSEEDIYGSIFSLNLPSPIKRKLL